MATSTAGKNSQPFTQVASSFNSGTSTAVNQTFQWQAEAAGNDTSTASGTLNLLFGQGSSKAAETGLHIASNGQINFAAGQTFPGTGTITGVAPGTDLTGGGSSGNVTLNLDTTKVPQLSGGNSFTGNQAVNGNVSATELVSTAAQGTAPLQVASTTQVANLNASFLDGFAASSFQVAGSYATLGANTFNATQTLSNGDVFLTNGNLDFPQTVGPTAGVITSSGFPFIHACCAFTSVNTFVGGNAGNFTVTGAGNTGTGYGALSGDTTGYYNAAFGVDALLSNTTGTFNLAAGAQAMQFNTIGGFDTAVGVQALYNSSGSDNVGVGYAAGNTTNNKATTGFDNTFVGDSANPGTQTSFNNVTAIGANAQVTAPNATAIGANAQATASNSLVLGSINGVNGATASTNVGIGTTSPLATLDVHGTGNFTGFITFANGQPFPGTGTVTNVSTGFGLKGGPVTNTGTLTLDTTVVPQLGAANTFTANQIVSGTVTATAFAGNGASVSNVNASQLGGLASSAFAQLAASNTFTGNQTVNGNLSATGIVTGVGFQIGSNLFDYGNYASSNAFLGFAGNMANNGAANTATGAFALSALSVNNYGDYNTANGYIALYSNTTGGNNTAFGGNTLSNNTTGYNNSASGFDALFYNSTGSSNTASGGAALFGNTTGYYNTASGVSSLPNDTSGSSNTAVGYRSGATFDDTSMTANLNTFLGAFSLASTGTISNATAIGANAEVTASNAMVLGSINGVNGATASTSVGIGTTAPGSTLEVQASNAQNLGPVVTITNNAVGPGTGAALDFNTITPAYGTAYNPTARIQAVDQGNFSSNIVFEANVQGALNHGLQTNMLIDAVGDVTIRGNLIKGGGSFKIDHPLDPANKYLSHSFVESPDMMNVYNGNVRTDRRGLAVVTLPDYFEALNRDFRYQLTVIGQFAQAIVAREISHHRFTIRTNRPEVKVSWQVTGIRHDAFADAHRIPNEEEKPQQERGHYLHPELFGASPEQAIGIRPLPVFREDEVDTAQMSREPR